MGRTLEYFELESNPAGKLSVTMSKGPGCITGTQDPGLSAIIPRSSRVGCDSTVTNTTTPIMMIHWGEIIHEILDCGLGIKSELSSNLWIPHTTKIRLFFPPSDQTVR